RRSPACAYPENASGIETRLAPGPVERFTPELEPVMQAERALLPELDQEWSQAVAGPVWRSWDRADCEFCGVKRDRLLEGVRALQRRRLFARPRADLGEPPPRPAINLSFPLL